MSQSIHRKIRGVSLGNQKDSAKSRYKKRDQAYHVTRRCAESCFLPDLTRLGVQTMRGTRSQTFLGQEEGQHNGPILLPVPNKSLKRDAERHNVTKNTITAAVMTMVPAHPSHRDTREIVNWPMIRGREAISMITTMIGAEIMPLITADQ